MRYENKKKLRHPLAASHIHTHQKRIVLSGNQGFKQASIEVLPIPTDSIPYSTCAVICGGIIRDRAYHEPCLRPNQLILSKLAGACPEISAENSISTCRRDTSLGILIVEHTSTNQSRQNDSATALSQPLPSRLLLEHFVDSA